MQSRVVLRSLVVVARVKTVAGLPALLLLTGMAAAQAPAAEFAGAPTSGVAPLTVAFTDLSTGAPTSWFWHFGDGAGSLVQHPSHTYQQAGLYTVSLTAKNAFGQDQETKVGYIAISAPPPPPDAQPFPFGRSPEVDFGASPSSGLAPLTVDFTDLSSASVTNWFWDFGDGETSTEKNPTHTYATGGRYSVFLDASSASGSGF